MKKDKIKIVEQLNNNSNYESIDQVKQIYYNKKQSKKPHVISDSDKFTIESRANDKIKNFINEDSD